MGKAFVHTYIIHAGRRDDIEQICLLMTMPGEREWATQIQSKERNSPYAADHLGYQSTDNKEGARDTNTWRPWNLLINKLANNPWHGMHFLPD